MRTTDGDNRMT